jgi:hypothetical protein
MHTDMHRNGGRFMKLKKFAAMSMAVAMAATALTGCGSDDKESGGSSKSESKAEAEVSATSMADAFSKASGIENCEYEIGLDFTIKTDELEETINSSDEAKEIFDTLGISGDELKVSLTFAGKTKGTDAQTLSIGYKFGNLSGTLTDFIYVDDTLYVNVAEVVSTVEDVADKFGMKDTISEYETLIPEGDYVAIPGATIEKVAEALCDEANISVEDLTVSLNDVDNAKAQDATVYFIEELEKIAKKADGAYSEKDGYTITVTKNNLSSLAEAFCSVVSEDAEDLVSKLKDLLGDDYLDELGVNADDLDEAVEELKDLNYDDYKDDFEGEIEELEDLDYTVSTNYTGTEGAAVWTFDVGVSINVEGTAVTCAINTKVTENQNVKITAPDSVMAEDDVNALLSMAGIDSVDDFIQMFTGNSYDYDYDDYDFDYDEDDAA